MLRLVRASAKHAIRASLYGVVGGAVIAISFLVVQLEGRPDLHHWHTIHLDAEFTADSPIETFADYLALEDELFEQLDAEIYDRSGSAATRLIDRYSHDSLSDPLRWPRNWNRSFEFQAEAARVGVLLIHGMSDSPYSMRSLGESLHDAGAWVLGLRVPGHGTAPSGLVDVTWQDMDAAVRLAMSHLREKVGSRPVFIVGYSNGGALGVQYALEALEDDQLVWPERLVLLSPEIGITKLAALAVWQERLGHLLGLGKLAWNSILPEYDPYKYGSFALNAGKQAYLITQEIQSRIAQLGAGDELKRFPPTLAFQSVVDATVSAPALVTGLFDPLPGAGHELVLFDINRFSGIEPILKHDPGSWLRAILDDTDKAFTVSVLMNASQNTRDVVLRRREAGSRDITQVELGMAWPADLYSLTHVALPFPPDDPLYGGPLAGASPGIQLGKLAMRGESGVLQIPASLMLRLRWNPFYDYIEQRVLDVAKELAAHGG